VVGSLVAWLAAGFPGAEVFLVDIDEKKRVAAETLGLRLLGKVPMDVDADVVYKLLSLIYTPEGLKHMLQQKKTFKEMAIETGANGIVTPFHPGAEKFWKEKGVLK
jgi:TRAP-type uncharacterized transport system substrate-binding protein